MNTSQIRIARRLVTSQFRRATSGAKTSVRINLTRLHSAGSGPARVNLGPTARRNLLLHYRVDVTEAPLKLRVPLRMATSPERVFNAIYLGGGTDSITSYLFVDVLEDELIVPLSDSMFYCFS